MFPPHIISSRTLNLERERRSPRLSASSPNGVKDMVADLVTPESRLLSRVGRRIQNQRRWSLTTSSRHRRHGKRNLNPPVMGGYIQGMRMGRMPTNCLWHACQALCIGIVLFGIGTVMAFLGFEADGVFTSNGTAVAGGRAYFYEDARGANVKFSKLSYAGPIVMGVGGFIIVSACVMTFEARDSAAKVGPAAYVASEEVSLPYPIISRPRVSNTGRVREVRTIGTQTTDPQHQHSSSDTLHIFDRKNLLETFRKFSRTVRQSSSKEDDIHRYPSAPNLFDEEDPGKSSAPKPAAIAARRSSCLPKFRNRAPPPLFRQAMSIDCSSSSSPFLPINPGGGGGHNNPHIGGSCGHIKVRKGQGGSGRNPSSENRTSVSGGLDNVFCPTSSQSTSRAASSLSMDNNTSSFGSGATVVRQQAGGGGGEGTVDLHLPNGMVTLNVIHTTGGSVLGGSSTCLRTLSPHPSYQSDDSCSFDMGSVKSDNILMPKSPMKPFKSFRSESFGRPTLVRQSKVDQHAEIIYIPDSDNDEQVVAEQPILEAEHESESDSN